MPLCTCFSCRLDQMMHLFTTGLEELGHRMHTLSNQIREGSKHTMARLDDVISEVNEGTNAVAARIDRLIADGATPAQIAELQAISDHLKLMGQDPGNVVPAPPAPVV